MLVVITPSGSGVFPPTATVVVILVGAVTKTRTCQCAYGVGRLVVGDPVRILTSFQARSASNNPFYCAVTTDQQALVRLQTPPQMSVSKFLYRLALCSLEVIVCTNSTE